MKVGLDIHWRLGATVPEHLDADLFRLLQGIQEGGSLRSAADQLNLSYRHVWGLMEKWARVLGQPLAKLERGRGAHLTPLGEKLLWAERRVAARLAPQLESLASELENEIGAALLSDRVVTVRIFASHGLAIGILRDLVNEQGRMHVDLQYRGSLESLRLLNSGRCDLAGFHLPDGDLGVRLASRYRPWLKPQTYRLITAVARQQGLMTAPGNPLGIASMADLGREGVRFENRQPGSGTRLLLDLLLKDAGIDPAGVRGYDSEEFTHMAVAAMVASGAVDAGFGIQAAAAQFGLNFIPVAREHYYFAVRRDALDRAEIGELIEVLNGAEFLRRVAALPGYDGTGAGRIAAVEEILPGTKAEV